MYLFIYVIYNIIYIIYIYIYVIYLNSINIRSKQWSLTTGHVSIYKLPIIKYEIFDLPDN